MELVDIESQDLGDTRQCRICLQEDSMENLISPCNCTGTQKYVHANCLSSWRRQFARMHVHRIRCQICKGDYTVEVSGYVVRPTTREIVPRRRQVRTTRRNRNNDSRKKILSRSIFTFQIISCINTLMTFLYLLFENRMIDMLLPRWIIHVHFFQSSANILCYLYYVQDLMYFLTCSTLLYYLMVYNAPWLLVCNIIHNIAIITHVCFDDHF